MRVTKKHFWKRVGRQSKTLLRTLFGPLDAPRNPPGTAKRKAERRATQRRRMDVPARTGDATTSDLVSRSYYLDLYQHTLKDWLFYHQREIAMTQVRWMGVRTLKGVLDLWIYQEILYEVQPDIVLELGSFHGGSTLFLAQILDLIGKGTVISVDINRANFSVTHDRIVAITGDCSSQDVLQQVSELCRNKSVLLIHDADHRQPSVLRDLRLYADFVPAGSYIIVEDSIVDVYPAASGDGVVPSFRDQGPLGAIEQFLQEYPAFEVDRSRERYWLTYNPMGYLKRVSGPNAQ